jgi:hypothetical protein
VHSTSVDDGSRDWYSIAEQPAPVPHLAHPEECAALRIVLVNVPRVSRSCEHSPDGFDLHILARAGKTPEEAAAQVAAYSGDLAACFSDLMAYSSDSTAYSGYLMSYSGY